MLDERDLHAAQVNGEEVSSRAGSGSGVHRKVAIRQYQRSYPALTSVSIFITIDPSDTTNLPKNWQPAWTSVTAGDSGFGDVRPFNALNDMGRAASAGRS